jgi:hypothetical protein
MTTIEALPCLRLRRPLALLHLDRLAVIVGPFHAQHVALALAGPQADQER